MKYTDWSLLIGVQWEAQNSFDLSDKLHVWDLDSTGGISPNAGDQI